MTRTLLFIALCLALPLTGWAVLGLLVLWVLTPGWER